MEVSTETDSDLGQSDPWTMLEDSDIEVCDEPSNSKEEASKEAAAKQSELTANQDVEEDDFAKLRKHRKFIEQLEAAEDLTWDSSDITPETTKIAEDSPTTKAVCTRCSICSVLLTKGGSKIASYLCNTFLALCVLVVASGLAYYFQFPDQIKKSNLKDVLLRYTQPDYAVRYDRYMEPKYEKNKKGFYHTDANKYIYYQKYDDTSRKREKKSKNDKYYGQKDNNYRKEYKRAQDKKRYYKNSLDEKRYDKKDFHKKAYKQEYREFKQKKNRK